MGQPQNQSSGWKPRGGKHPNPSCTIHAQTRFARGRPGRCLPRAGTHLCPSSTGHVLLLHPMLIKPPSPEMQLQIKALPWPSHPTPELCQHG